MFKQLYQKSLKLTVHKNAKFFLALISFAESSFFPIPPDIMIVPMVVAKRTDYKKIFLIATLFSAIGGLFGYFIGSVFLEFAMKIVEFYGYESRVINLKNNLSSGGGLYVWLGTLFLAGFTPLPFKVFTITSGIISFNIIIFFFICLIARGLRFFIVAFLSAKFGIIFSTFLNKEGSKWFTIIGLVIVTIAIIVYFIIK
jgi:membrane protein YqaA with SNARE-associated domain|tara:strand:+ start:63 stop:659 length:597 start_codon:yes stop_codon:yes gene_type:complete